MFIPLLMTAFVYFVMTTTIAFFMDQTRKGSYKPVIRTEEIKKQYDDKQVMTEFPLMTNKEVLVMGSFWIRKIDFLTLLNLLKNLLAEEGVLQRPMHQ